MRMNLSKRILIAVICVMFALVSILFGDRYASQAEHHSHQENVIQKDIDRVLVLTASVTATSAVISAIPDDTCTPIADQLADLSKYLIIILSILYLEKYLLTLSGVISFIWIIPAAIVLYGIGKVTFRDAFKALAIKLGIFAFVLYFIIPTSVYLTDKIYDVYNSSVDQTIDEASDITDDSSSFLDKVTNITTSATTYVSNIVNKFIESVAVLLVTACLIPVLVMFVLFGAMKVLFNIDVSKTEPVQQMYNRLKKKDVPGIETEER